MPAGCCGHGKKFSEPYKDCGRQDDLQAYIFDRGWAGSTVILAHSKEEAFALYKEDGKDPYYTEPEKDFVEAKPLEAGLLYDNMGDR